MHAEGQAGGQGRRLLAGAAVAGLLGLSALTAALIALLDECDGPWVAALIVMVLWRDRAAVLAKAGQKALQQATPLCRRPSRP